MIDNQTIADQLILLSKLMEIHGENPFKARSYALAAYEIEKLNKPITTFTAEEIQQIKGIGEAIGKKIQQIIRDAQFPLLQKYIDNTPPGVIEMLQIKGLGPKKIRVIWKEMGIESIGELLYACHENRLLHHKGFGPKSQESIRNEILFYYPRKENFSMQKQYIWQQKSDNNGKYICPNHILPIQDLSAGKWKLLTGLRS